MSADPGRSDRLWSEIILVRERLFELQSAWTRLGSSGICRRDCVSYFTTNVCKRHCIFQSMLRPGKQTRGTEALMLSPLDLGLPGVTHNTTKAARGTTGVGNRLKVAHNQTWPRSPQLRKAMNLHMHSTRILDQWPVVQSGFTEEQHTDSGRPLSRSYHSVIWIFSNPETAFDQRI